MEGHTTGGVETGAMLSPDHTNAHILRAEINNKILALP